MGARPCIEPEVQLPPSEQSALIEREGLEHLFQELETRGYEVIGPTVRGGAIVYERIHSTGDLPAGCTDEQHGGRYRLKFRDDAALFGYVVGPHTWRRFLYPPVQRLWQAERNGKGFQFHGEEAKPPKQALIGVRSCELHALELQDKIFLAGPYPDPTYQARRNDLFIVAVNCGQAGGTCFCASMKTGPRATSGYDLALTEFANDTPARFLVDAGSELGAEVLSAIPHRAANESDRTAADRLLAETARHMGRSMDTHGMKELLYRNSENPEWDVVASRCLSCGNCTMVCPTCFCTTIEDVTDLSGKHAERQRRWDSCFTVDFSYIHGGSVRASVKSRYRQWMTHKLATWIDQFGAPGCVGCGRCITWCPVGIDLTAELHTIRDTDSTNTATEAEQGFA